MVARGFTVLIDDILSAASLAPPTEFTLAHSFAVSLVGVQLNVQDGPPNPVSIWRQR